MKNICLYFILLFFPIYADACLCIGNASVKKELKKCDVVFIGKVISKELMKIPYNEHGLFYDTVYRYKVTFQIEHVYKGIIDTNCIEVITGIGDGDCGFSFEMDKNYVVYAMKKNKHNNVAPVVESFLDVNRCSRTTEEVQRERIEIEKYWKPHMLKNEKNKRPARTGIKSKKSG